MWPGVLTFFSFQTGHIVYQVMALCEHLDNDKSGQMITKNAYRGSTIDELHFLDGKFTYHGSLNFTTQQIKPYLELSMWRHENIFYPACIKTLKNYLKNRGTQVNRKSTYTCIFSMQ